MTATPEQRELIESLREGDRVQWTTLEMVFNTRRIATVWCTVTKRKGMLWIDGLSPSSLIDAENFSDIKLLERAKRGATKRYVTHIDKQGLIWCRSDKDPDKYGSINRPMQLTASDFDEAPTIRASVLATQEFSDYAHERGLTDTRCHSFVTDGQIAFLIDCTHAMAGQTVPLPDYPLDGDTR